MKKALATTAVIFITVFVVSGMILYGYLNSFSGKNDGDNGGIIEPKEIKRGEPFNVLLMGVDVGTVGSKNSPKRSDTMVVFHYDPETNEVAMVSIPRDTKVTIKGSPEKINAANAYGGKELAIKTVEDLLDIEINYYVEVDYEGFRKFVDAIGGIDVIIPYNMNYDDDAQDLHIHFKKGQSVHLDGQKAEEYVRWRKNNNNTGYAEGDLGRIKTQQDFMVKMLEKLKSPAIIPRLPAIIKILPEYINTNMDAMAIINMSKDVLPKINTESIQKYTLEGESKIINGIWYFIYQPEKNRDVIAMLGGNPPQTAQKVNNKDIKVQVFNASGINGAAAKVRRGLEEKGYTVVGIGNISGVNFTASHIIDKTLKGNNAKQIASELDISHIEKNQDSLSNVDIVVVIGNDKQDALK